MAAIAKVIQYEGDNSFFIKKHKFEDFNTTSQLIVHESQEAVLFRNGQALDLFGAGRYTLQTENIPLLRNIINIPTGGKTPFHCEVYFINKTQHLAIKWGTDSQVQYMEPTYNFPLKIGVSGEMVLSVEDSRKLLVKVVGTEKELTTEGLKQSFRGILMSKIKPYVAKTMQEADFTIFEADSHMEEMSESLKALLIEDFADYGLTLDRFYVVNVVKPDGDPGYEKFKSLHIRQYTDVAEAKLKQQVSIIDEETEKQRMIIEAEGIAEKRRLEGYTYAQERGFDVAEKVAENESIGEFTNMGVGFGTMAGVGGAVGGMVGGMMNDAIGTDNMSLKQRDTDGSDDMVQFKQKLEKLKMMKEMGLLTDEEFEQQRIKLIGSI